MKTLSVKQKNPERLPEGQTFPESFFFLTLPPQSWASNWAWRPWWHWAGVLYLPEELCKTYPCHLCLKTVQAATALLSRGEGTGLGGSEYQLATYPASYHHTG